MMKRFCVLGLILIVLASLSSAQVKYTTPRCRAMHVSQLLAINNNGSMVGAYETATDPISHALLIKNGKCIPLGRNTVLAQKFSFASSVNDRGDITGAYFDGGIFTGPVHGFLLDKDGVLTILNFPGADDTYAWAISPFGTVVGGWAVNDSSGNMLFQHGYVWKDGNFSDIVYPAYYRTLLSGMNARGDAIGTGIDPDGTGHAFIYSRGEITPITDLPPGAIGSSPQGINDKGEMVGQFWDQNFTTHGYLRAGSEYKTIDFPGAVFTGAQGVNNAGLIVGAYFDTNWGLHGFIAEVQK
jgi:uncharacterized membrane protein